MRRHCTRCIAVGFGVLALTAALPTGAGEGGEPVTNAVGLLAHYPLDGKANDVTKAHRDGKLVGTSAVRDRHGKEGGALGFDGVGDMMVIDPPPPLNATGTTVSVWALFKFDGTNTEWQDIYDGPGFSHPIVLQDDGSGIRVLCMCLWKGKFRSNGQGYGHSLASKEVAKADTWYHIALTRDGKRHRLYANGQKVCDEGDLFSVCHCHPMLIGGQVQSTGEKHSFFGSLDDLRFYGRVLTDEEIGHLSAE